MRFRTGRFESLSTSSLILRPPERRVTQGVVLPEAFYALSASKRAQAFTVSGLAKLDQVQSVADALARFQLDGGTLGQFQAWAKGQDFGLPRHRLETIYRNATQTAYEAGHWRSFDETADDLPFLMYDAVNDSRTRPAHRALDGTIRPVGDAFWRTHPQCCPTVAAAHCAS